MDSAAWDRRYAGGEYLWSSHANRFLKEEAEGLAPGRAIDLACGQGRNAVWLAKRGWAVTAVDFSSVGVRQARRLAAEHGVSVDWVQSDLLEYRSEPQAFDFALIFYLQVVQEDRTAIVSAAADGVRSGGTFLLVGHHTDNIGHGHGGPQNPTLLYTAEEIVADLEGSGLRVERAERVRRPVETPAGERIALDTLVRARR
jgi:SAM-dependent methyltransferase